MGRFALGQAVPRTEDPRLLRGAPFVHARHHAVVVELHSEARAVLRGQHEHHCLLLVTVVWRRRWRFERGRGWVDAFPEERVQRRRRRGRERRKLARCASNSGSDASSPRLWKLVVVSTIGAAAPWPVTVEVVVVVVCGPPPRGDGGTDLRR